MTKKERVYNILKMYKDGGIHSFTAKDYFHRFAAYVCFLRKDGHNIVSIPEKMGRDWGCRYILKDTVDNDTTDMS